MDYEFGIISGIVTIALVLLFTKREKKVPDYKAYLNSNHWKRVRKRTLKHYGYKCMICGNTNNLQVHHNNYKCLNHECYKDLIVLCSYHHKMIHGKLKEDINGKL